jgi:hypothetical protein
MAKNKKVSKKKPVKKLVVALVDSISGDIMVVDVHKLDTKNDNLALLKESVLDAVKNEDTEISVSINACPSNLEYADYRKAEVELPHKVDAIITVGADEDI